MSFSKELAISITYFDAIKQLQYFQKKSSFLACMMKVIIFFIYLFILANFAEKKVARLLYTSAANTHF